MWHSQHCSFLFYKLPMRQLTIALARGDEWAFYKLPMRQLTQTFYGSSLLEFYKLPMRQLTKVDLRL